MIRAQGEELVHLADSEGGVLCCASAWLAYRREHRELMETVELLLTIALYPESGEQCQIIENAKALVARIKKDA